MKNKKINLQGGFLPVIVIAIVAILAVGGGAYVVQKNKQAKINTEVNAELEGNVETQANSNADANANVNANLGVNANVNAKGSIRSLLGLGKSTVCTFTSTAQGVNSSGTVYIATDGSMRGDFTSQTSAGAQASSMIVAGETSYVWSGTQGIKMNVKGNSNANANTSANTKSNVDLDSQVDYKCVDWNKDASKFAVPSSVNFLDIEAMMKASGGVKLPTGY